MRFISEYCDDPLNGMTYNITLWTGMSNKYVILWLHGRRHQKCANDKNVVPALRGLSNSSNTKNYNRESGKIIPKLSSNTYLTCPSGILISVVGAMVW